MAVTFTTEMGRAGALYVDFPENILIEPELNGRHEHTEIEDLAADIEKNGQMSPVGIRKNDDSKPVLIYGHRRYRAISLLNERNPAAKRKIFCTYHGVSETEAFAMAIGENRFRRDVSPIDDCANITVMTRRFGQTLEDIARVYFPEARTEDERAVALKFVKDRAALVELAPEAAQAVRDGRVKLTAAKALAKLTAKQQRDKVAGTGKVKVASIAPKPASPKTSLLDLVNTLLEDVPQTDLNDESLKYLEVDRKAVLAIFEFVTR